VGHTCSIGKLAWNLSGAIGNVNAREIISLCAEVSQPFNNQPDCFSWESEWDHSILGGNAATLVSLHKLSWCWNVQYSVGKGGRLRRRRSTILNLDHWSWINEVFFVQRFCVNWFLLNLFEIKIVRLYLYVPLLQLSII